MGFVLWCVTGCCNLLFRFVGPDSYVVCYCFWLGLCLFCLTVYFVWV